MSLSLLWPSGILFLQSFLNLLLFLLYYIYMFVNKKIFIYMDGPENLLRVGVSAVRKINYLRVME